MIQPFSSNSKFGIALAQNEHNFRDKTGFEHQITGKQPQNPLKNDEFLLTNAAKQQKVSFHGFLRHNLNKIINRKPQNITQESGENKTNGKKMLRNAAIAAGSVIGAGAFLLAGVYFYKKPTKADKALIQLLEEKFLPFQNAISGVKDEIKTFRSEFEKKKEKLFEPVLKDFENFQKLPEKANKENADEVYAQIQEFKKNSLPDSYFENAAKEMDELCETYLQKISQKFEQVEPKYKDFTQTLNGELSKSRHSKKIIESYKEKADFDYKEAMSAKKAYEIIPKSLSLSFQELMIEVQTTEFLHINKLLEDILK